MTTGQGIAVLGIWLGAAGMAGAAAVAAALTGDSGTVTLIMPVAIAAALATFCVA